MTERKVAILGVGPLTAHLAPWDDHAWEMWGLARHHIDTAADRIFEMHVDGVASRVDLERLSRVMVPIYMQEAEPEVPTSVGYPFEEVIALAGFDYFECSMAYMIGLAVLEGVAAIGLWGIEGLEDQYAYQRSNIHSWLGVARGRGIRVENAEGCTLEKGVGRYGTLEFAKAREAASANPLSPEYFAERAATYRQNQADAEKSAEAWALVAGDNEGLRELARHLQRGGVMPGGMRDA